jgi:hypothetical protein
LLEWGSWFSVFGSRFSVRWGRGFGRQSGDLSVGGWLSGVHHRDAECTEREKECWNAGSRFWVLDL